MENEEVRRILQAAAVQDPSIGPGAVRVARRCLAIHAADRSLDASELARRCVAELPDADASWVAHIARAVTAYSASGGGRSGP